MADIIPNRGNPSLLKAIQQGAKKVSESNGLTEGMQIPNSSHSMVGDKVVMNAVNSYQSSNGGAYNSVMSRGSQVSKPKNIDESVFTPLLDRLYESVETVRETGEYFNAAQSLFTLHTLGKLNEGLIDSLRREDLREIKGIIREFKDVIDSY